MIKLAASLTTLFLATVLPPAQVAGDTHVQGYPAAPLNTTTQASVDAGLASLAGYDPATAGEISDAVNNGTLEIGELTGGNSTTKGASDGNTITVRLSDNPSSGMIGVRIRHEWRHWKHGHGTNGGVLTACEEFENMVDTYLQGVYIGCEGVHIDCRWVDMMAKRVDKYFELCQKFGGSPAWPTSLPVVCCE